jgi:glycosyltransferase involved in cell wall biosynthesis
VSGDPELRVLLVDPSLFTAPYDAALNEGLKSAGVRPTWAVRPTRAADRQELPADVSEPLFYGWIERQTRLSPKLRTLAKGVSHAWGLAKLVQRVVQKKPDVVHFQWVVVPPLDSLAMLLLATFSPLVLTVHDTVPYNGDRMSWLQRWGFELPLRLCDRIIVHTRAGREALLARGLSPEKVSVIPHGALPLRERPTPAALTHAPDGLYRFVAFGEMKQYKGLDVLMEALALMPEQTRNQARVIIAGRPRMDLAPLTSCIERLGLSELVELRARRLSEPEMADLFHLADCFVFPYRQIDASGVYFLVKSLGKWLIASRVGVFAEDVLDGAQGELVAVADAQALADAMTAAVAGRRAPVPVAAGTDWADIGKATSELYRNLRASRAKAPGASAQVGAAT